MTEKEREILRLMYDLQLELSDAQGEQIAGLRKAIDSLNRSHEILAKLMRATGDLLGVH